LSEYVFYPEGIDEVSILNDERVKTPIHRISLMEESDTPIFNNDTHSYDDENCKIGYTITGIKDNPDDEETIIISLADVDFPDRTFEIAIQIHQVNAAFLISQMLKTPMFMIAPSDDVIASLGFGPFEKEEVKVIVEAPVRRTPEFTKISKKIFELSKHDAPPVPSLSVPPQIVNKVRGEIMDMILGLVNGNPESLQLAYSYIPILDKTVSMDLSKKDELSPEDVEAIVMKDMLLKLEDTTHPISMSHMFSETRNSREYTRDIEEFESIINDSGMSLDIKEMHTPTSITHDSADEDVVAYINAPIDLNYMPDKIQGLMMNVELSDFWNFKWHSALEETVKFEELPSAGEFFISMTLVIAIRLARLNELYLISKNPDLSPLANLTNGLTQQGESFTWVVKEAVRLLSEDKSAALIGLLTIPPDLAIGNLNGPSTLLLHGIAHSIMDLELPRSAIESALSNEPNIVAFANKVFEAKSVVPELVQALEEDLCFIKGVVVGFLQDGVIITPEYADEMIRAVQTLAEMTLIKNTDFAVNTPEWNAGMQDFYGKLLR
jgi:hypothetical protein